METCPHCNYQSNDSYPNCPSCGLIKDLDKYNDMRTFLSNGREFENGKFTDFCLDAESFSNLRRRIQNSVV